MSFKRGKVKRVDRYDVRNVWKKLPHDLKTFDGWYYSSGDSGEGDPAGPRDWSGAVADWLDREFGNDPKRPTPVQVGAVGGLTYSAWYRHILSG